MADQRIFRPYSPRIRNSGILRPETPNFTVPGIKLTNTPNLTSLNLGGGRVPEDLPPIIFEGLYRNDLKLADQFFGVTTGEEYTIGDGVAINGFGDYIAFNGERINSSNHITDVSAYKYEHVLSNLSAQNDSELGARFYDTVSSKFLSNSGSGSLYYNASAGAIQFDGIDDYVDLQFIPNSNLEIECVYRWVGGDTVFVSPRNGNYPIFGADGGTSSLISKSILFSFGLKKDGAGVEYYQTCYGNRDGESGCDFVKTGVGATAQTSFDPRDYSKFVKVRLSNGVWYLSDEDGSNEEVVSNRCNPNTQGVELPFENNCSFILGASNSDTGPQRFTNIEIKSFKATQTNRPYPSERFSSKNYLSSTEFKHITTFKPIIRNIFQGFGNGDGQTSIAYSQDGKTIAILGRGDDSNTGNGGAVYVYSEADHGEYEGYRAKGQVIYGTPNVNSSANFGPIALSQDGNLLFVGNRYDTSILGDTFAGSVSALRYLSANDGSSYWKVESSVEGPSGTNVSFGGNFDINYDGTKLAVSDRGFNSNNGTVHFYISGAGSSQFTLLTSFVDQNTSKITNTQFSKRYGNYLSISPLGNKLAASSPKRKAAWDLLLNPDNRPTGSSDTVIDDIGAYDIFDISVMPERTTVLSADYSNNLQPKDDVSFLFPDNREAFFGGVTKFNYDGSIFLGSGDVLFNNPFYPVDQAGAGFAADGGPNARNAGYINIHALSALHLQRDTRLMSTSAVQMFDDSFKPQEYRELINNYGRLYTHQGFINDVGLLDTRDVGILSGSNRTALDNFGNVDYDQSMYGSNYNIDNSFDSLIVGAQGFFALNSEPGVSDNGKRGLVQVFKRENEPDYYYQTRHISNGFTQNIDNLYMNISFSKMSITRVSAATEGLPRPPFQIRGDIQDPMVVKFTLTEDGNDSVQQLALFGSQNTDDGVSSSYSTGTNNDPMRDAVDGIVDFTYYVPADNPMVGEYWQVGTSFSSSIGGPLSYSPNGVKIVGGEWTKVKLYYGARFGGVDKSMSVRRFIANFKQAGKLLNDGTDERGSPGKTGDHFYISEYIISNRFDKAKSTNP